MLSEIILSVLHCGLWLFFVLNLYIYNFYKNKAYTNIKAQNC